MFNINFAEFGKKLTPWFLRTARNKQWIGSMLWGLSLALADLNIFRTKKQFELNFDGRRIYLEKWLNLKFDDLLQEITVENVQFDTPIYLFNQIENQPFYLFNNYKSGTAYSVDDYISFDGSVWKCIQAGTGQQPDVSPLYWEFFQNQTYLFNRDELTATISFIVTVPISIPLNIQNIAAISKEIEKFVIAGKKYSIVSA